MQDSSVDLVRTYRQGHADARGEGCLCGEWEWSEERGMQDRGQIEWVGRLGSRTQAYQEMKLIG